MTNTRAEANTGYSIHGTANTSVRQELHAVVTSVPQVLVSPNVEGE